MTIPRNKNGLNDWIYEKANSEKADSSKKSMKQIALVTADQRACVPLAG